ncbi:hypothetical protein LIN78_05345 [Leeia sp. TBRC 13508]|uniref:Uncharacterized protein n=1 Tax=Leeia speluncae TaxID=2884804 RepID=A0ABS8D467_9NEIS|nr:hypothetical protein [Leeia speluncae]MCB6182972.1 hypothetical protein [Leeia speluncae]
MLEPMQALLDNGGSLKHKRHAKAVILQLGTLPRQIMGGLRIVAGGLPSMGVSVRGNAPTVLCSESTPTRFIAAEKSLKHKEA